MHRRLAPLGLAALMAASCTQAPAPALERFPIGVLGVRQAAEVDALADNGFDTFMAVADTATVKALAAQARRRGVRLMASPGAFREAGAAPLDMPLDAWNAYEVSDGVGLSSAALAAEITAVRTWDPGRPVTFSIGHGASVQKYAGMGDALLLGWPSAPRLPVGAAADEIDKAYWFTGGRPLWLFVRGTMPGHGELRAVTYLAVVHGAKGIFYPGPTAAPMARELRAMQPIFTANRRVTTPFEPRPGGVEAACWRWRGRDYVVLVNRHLDKQLRVPVQLLDRSWRPLFEQRRDTKELLKAAQGGHYLPPLRVLVLESGIRWRELIGLRRAGPAS